MSYDTQTSFFPEPSKPILVYQVFCQLVGNLVIPAIAIYAIASLVIR